MTVVAPLDYARLLFAGFLGYVAFGEIPDETAVLGALIIVTSGFFILRCSAVSHRAEKLADASDALDSERRDIDRRRPPGDEIGDDPPGH